MAIGRVDYRKSTNLEPIASAINGMGQQASKKDKPIILGQKISAISTDATATPAQVLIGQTFYSAGKKQQGIIPIAGGTETPVSVSKQNNYDLSVFPPAKYFKGTTESGILLPIGTLRGQGYALQSEVDTWKNNYNSKVIELASMTTDRDNWKNIANSRYVYGRYTLSSLSCEYYYKDNYFFRSGAITLPISKFISASASAKVKFSGPGMNGYTFYFPTGGIYYKNTRFAYRVSSYETGYKENYNLFAYTGYPGTANGETQSVASLCTSLFEGDNKIKLCIYSYYNACPSEASGCEFQDIVIDYIGIQ